MTETFPTHVHCDEPGLCNLPGNTDPANQYVGFGQMRKALSEQLRAHNPKLTRDQARALAHRVLSPAYAKLAPVEMEI